MNALTSTLASPESAASMQAFAMMAINVASGIANAFITAHQAFKHFMNFMDPVVTEQAGGSMQSAFPTSYGNAMDDLRKNLDLRNRGLGTGMDVYGFDDFQFPEAPNFDVPATQLEVLGDAMSAANNNTIDLMEGLDQVGKSAAQMGIEAGRGAASVLGSLAGLSSGLANTFEGNKALSVATAVLRGAESVTSAFAAGNATAGGPLVGAVNTGIAAITAAANVSAVMSVGKSSKPMPAMGVGSGASIPTAPANQGCGTSTLVTLVGSSFNMPEFFLSS